MLSLCSTIRQRYNVNLEHFSPDSHKLLCAIEDQKKAKQTREKRKASRENRVWDQNTDDESSESKEDNIEQEIEEVISQGNQPDWSFVELVIDELKQKLDSMGPVNIDAIEEFESLIINHSLLDQVRNEILDLFISKKYSDLATIKDFISKNYNEILKKELKFSKKYWSNHENSTIETISSIWVEIFEDDQHIKSLEIELNNFDMNVKDDNNEKRLIHNITDKLSEDIIDKIINKLNVI